MEFDGEGNLIQAWGGSGEGYDWPQTLPRIRSFLHRSPYK
jgi:hypothetical protein